MDINGEANLPLDGNGLTDLPDCRCSGIENWGGKDIECSSWGNLDNGVTANQGCAGEEKSSDIRLDEHDIDNWLRLNLRFKKRICCFDKTIPMLSFIPTRARRILPALRISNCKRSFSGVSD